MTSVFTGKFKATKHSEDSNYKSAQLSKMPGEDALLMSSLAVILAIYFRKRLNFVQTMRLMARQMQVMRQNVVILSTQSQNNIHCLISSGLSKAAVLIRTSCCKTLQRSSVARALQSEHPAGPEEL